MAVSKRLRYEVLRRDNHSCRYCGAAAPDAKLAIDHVTPASLGGADSPDNLVTACVDCNIGKTSSSPDAPLVEDVRRDAVRWARARDAVSALLEQERDAALRPQQVFEQAWGDTTYRYYLPASWPDSIDAFVRAGLNEDDLLFCVGRAMRAPGVSNRFKYFCGVAWSVVRDKQQLTTKVAQAMADEEEATG
jgi:hypothetical protein